MATMHSSIQIHFSTSEENVSSLEGMHNNNTQLLLVHIIMIFLVSVSSELLPLQSKRESKND